MKDPKTHSDQNAAPEDVATLYSWANLHGAKYRDFSAARAQTRERARLRAEQALQEEQRQMLPEAAAAATEAVGSEVPAAETAILSEEIPAAEAAHAAGAEATSDQSAMSEAAGSEVAAQEQAVERGEIEPAGLNPVEAQPGEVQQDPAVHEAEEARKRLAAQAAEQAAREVALAAKLAAVQRVAEQEARLEEEQAARRGAQQAAELAALKAAQRARDHAAYLAEQEAAERLVQRAAEQAAQQTSQQRSQQQTWQQQPPAVRFPATSYPSSAQRADTGIWSRPRPFYPAAGPIPAPFSDAPGANLPRSERSVEDRRAGRDSQTAADVREPAFRPAWLNTETRPVPGPFSPAQVYPDTNSPAAAAPPDGRSLQPAPGATAQGSRDRLTSRWFALRGVFEAPPVEADPEAAVSWPPTLAVFSLAGGVGKTSLVATLGRALSARGERVLLVDTAAFGLLPFFFGATDQRPGMLRIFAPPIDSNDAPIQMVTIDPDGLGSDQPNPESLSGEIGKYTRGAGRILIDLATANSATTRRVMRMAPLVLVPVIADMNSVVSVSSIDAFFEHTHNAAGQPVLPYYVLNQFDATLPLHLDVREVLREQLGGRLLPFALRRAAAMSEALAEGMTVMDYAPGSTLAEDFNTLAGWVRSLAAPAASSDRGVRWSER